MILFEKARRNGDALRQIGARALDDARRAGVPVYYLDPGVGEGIVREFPDGRRERLVRGEKVVAVPIDPRR